MFPKLDILSLAFSIEGPNEPRPPRPAFCLPDKPGPVVLLDPESTIDFSNLGLKDVFHVQATGFMRLKTVICD